MDPVSVITSLLQYGVLGIAAIVMVFVIKKLYNRIENMQNQFNELTKETSQIIQRNADITAQNTEVIKELKDLLVGVLMKNKE